MVIVPDFPMSTHATSLELFCPVITPPHKRAKQAERWAEDALMKWSGTGVRRLIMYIYNHKQWLALVLTYICGQIKASRPFNNIWMPPAPEISEVFRFEADDFHSLDLQLNVDVSFQCQQNERRCGPSRWRTHVLQGDVPRTKHVQSLRIPQLGIRLLDDLFDIPHLPLEAWRIPDQARMPGQHCE